MPHKQDPYKAPWPPGVDTRMIDDPKLGKVAQLRDGGTTPPKRHTFRVRGGLVSLAFRPAVEP